MEQIFKNNCTQDAFDAWLNNNGITPHPMDEERFYTFAFEYFKNEEYIDQRAFVKICKKYTHTTRTENRGICQKYYQRLITLVNFMKWNKKTHKL